MDKKAIIVLAEGFEEIEAVSVIDVLRRADIEIFIAGLEDMNPQGSHGITVGADKLLEECDDRYDAVIFPGGMPGAAHLGASEKVKEMIQKADSENKIIAAICASPALVLAPSGILKNRKATCFPGMQKNFDPDTSFSEEKVVIDGNIITSRGPGTAILFALAVIEKLIGKERSDKVRKATLAG